MYQFRFRGSYYEIGYEQGKMMRAGTLPGLEFTLKPPSKERAAITDECEDIVRKYTPEYLEEFQGVADGLDIDYNLAKVWPLALYSRFANSCSVVMVSGKYTANGKPLIIRNYDFFLEDQETFTAFWTVPTNRFASIGFCDFFGSRYGGVNEKGLAIAISSSPYIRGTQPGYAMSLAPRGVLDNLSTTQEAVDFLVKIPHFHGFNFIVCDKDNNMARVETCPENVAVLHFNGLGISTNHYITDEMQEYQSPAYFGSSVDRYRKIEDWFNNRQNLLDFEDAKELASNHERGVCDHFDAGKEAGTIWSWIHSIGEKELLVSHGAPCKNDYQKIALDFNFS
ncbi:MAG: C45 family autoproteolytic acyltransferase/hydrolase [Candidatus Hodarchaeales archaeon]